ncbi:hypothetical protein CAMSH0001_0085 [Campylobacter showae RM3277]|uniref:Uncharacterized protein n=1 Tax=Campylobacter showae RM3277 TaxID=553219 RepID=C6RIY9_9BACT|nr:hypothetical protein CAMSH0001_0085 [Campylobacter showae RM3277]
MGLILAKKLFIYLEVDYFIALNLALRLQLNLKTRIKFAG